MFDIGFSELLLFGVIALIVLGPEKLPKAARSAGRWYAKLRRTVATLQSEMEAEFDLAETRQQMQQELAKIRETEADMRREMAEMRGNMRDFKNSQEDSLKTHSTAFSKEQADSIANNNSQNSNSPAEFAYAYHNDQAIAADSELALVAANTNAENQIDNPVPTIMTRPWENMWFLLGAYDKSRRMPKAPYLPNYKADVLLYSKADTANTGNANLNTQQAKL